MDNRVYQAFSHELQKYSRAETPEEAKKIQRARSLFKELKKGQDIPIHVRPDDPVAKASIAYFDPKKNEIVLSKKDDYEALAHELGHADFHKSTLGRVVQNPGVRGASALLSQLGGVGVGTLTGSALAGAVTPVVASVPLLTGEAVASVKGRSSLKERGASDEELGRYRNRMLKAFSTYGQFPLVGAAAGAATGWMHGQVNKAEMAQKARREELLRNFADRRIVGRAPLGGL